MRLEVRPIYGWGWYSAKGDAVDVPAPFEFDAKETGNPGELSGHFGDAQHQLSGFWILLSARLSPDRNLPAFRKEPAQAAQPTVTGFAEVHETRQSDNDACASSGTR